MSNQGLEQMVFERLKGRFTGYDLRRGQSLLYQVVVDEALRFQPVDPRSPTRGGSAFETDISITRNQEPKTPLVVIEVKASLTTHDVITHSAKAAKHKNVYPYLRYGIVFSGESPAIIPGRFFVHNSDLDFAISMKVAGENDFSTDSTKLVELVQSQIAVSEYLIKLMNGTSKVSMYESLLKLN